MKKKMAARIVSMIMAGILTVGMLAGCGSGSSESNDSGKGHSRQETVAQGGDDIDAVDGGSDPSMWMTEATAGAVYDSMNGYAMEAPMSEAEDYYDYDYGYEEIPFNTEEYSTLEENPYMSVALSPLSTFSADVDTASYANLRRMIMNGYSAATIPSGAVRTEEMLNYFSYDYNGPKKGEPFGVTATISQCPWNEDAELLVLGLQTEAIDFSDAPDSNLVFLIDVSGSMYDENKLPLLKEAFGLLIDNLGRKDRVSIVTYASYNEVVLEGVRGSEKDTILDALNGLEAGGSTNGGEGIMTAYALAEKYFIKGGNNRIILATDGDLNVGITSESELHDLVEEKRESGVFLSVLGFGMGNYSDTRMETLADYASATRDTDILTEYVRQSLKRAISTKFFPEHETTSVVTLDPKIEQEIMGSVKQTETGAFLNLEPARARAIMEAVGNEVKKLENLGKNPIVITSPIVRLYFRRLIEDNFRDLVVVSYNEVEPNIELQSVGMVTA